jgi:release factor glutamine methyltransferase
MRLDALCDRVVHCLDGKSDTPELDAQVLLAHLLRKPRSWLLAHPEAAAPRGLLAVLEAAVRRLEGGEPLPYVLGAWEFFGLSFVVTPDVLIPRPETELLVERALDWLRAHPKKRRVLDVGTGSGCIAVALAVHLPDLHVLATDISAGAIEVARSNAARLGVGGRVEFVQCDLLPCVDREPRSTVHGLPPYDLIVANLPYIPTRTLHKLPIYRREPTLALDGGKDGLDIVRRLLAAAPEVLARGGMMLLEIEASQGAKALSLAFDAFSEAEIHLHQDLAGRDRLMKITIREE